MIGCKKCGECCRWLAIQVKNLDEDSKRWANYHDGKVEGNVIYFPLRCSMLTDDGLCKIHEERPITCMNFPLGAAMPLRPKECKFYEDNKE